MANVGVKAKADSDEYDYPPYRCTGYCSISYYSAGGSTTSTPQTSVSVSGTFWYFLNPGSDNPSLHSLYEYNVSPDGYAHVSFSISGDRKSYSITCEHSIIGSGRSIDTHEEY